MDFFDTIWARTFQFGLLASQLFATVLYLGIFFLTLWTLAETGKWLLGA